MSRRVFISQLLALPFAGLLNLGAQEVPQGTHKKLKIMMKSRQRGINANAGERCAIANRK
jgi:hypothetical protein